METYKVLEMFKPRRKTAYCSEEAQELVSEILDLIHSKRLTYIEAYASLEEVYNILQFQSNFVNIQLAPQLEKPEWNLYY